jgi:hypothetical protein
VALRRVYLVYSSDRADGSTVESPRPFAAASSSTLTDVASGWKALIAASMRAAAGQSALEPALSLT